ncbi:hypothetical protein ACWGMW_03980 [Streptomyces albidoflavus]
MRGKAIAAGAVATLAVVAGVTYWAVSGDDEPFTVSGYKAMCQKPREYTEAAPHAGSGPRPVYIDGFWPLTDTDAKELNASSEAATTTHSWAPPARTPSPCTSIHTRSSPTTAPATSPRSGAGGRPQEIESNQEHRNEEYRSEPQEGQASTAWIFFHQLSQKECDLKGRRCGKT